jgi:hypothetical protein
MKPNRFWAVVSALVLMAGPALAQTQKQPVGTWKGTVRFIDVQKPAGLGRDSGDKTEYRLVLNADKTFSRQVKTPEGKTNTSTGLWSAKDNEIQLTIMKVNGNSLQRPGVSKLALGPDGKTLRLRIAFVKKPGKNLPKPGESVQVVFQPTK